MQLISPYFDGNVQASAIMVFAFVSLATTAWRANFLPSTATVCQVAQQSSCIHYHLPSTFISMPGPTRETQAGGCGVRCSIQRTVLSTRM